MTRRPVAREEPSVFGRKTLEDILREVRRNIEYRFWGYPDMWDDAVQVAALTLLEYWMPKYVTDDAVRNYRFALRYANFRAADYLIREGDILMGQLPLDSEEGEQHVLELEDPHPGPEDLICSDAVVREVRELVDELDWQNCFTEETTRDESRRRRVNQSSVSRARARSRNCMRAAYIKVSA